MASIGSGRESSNRRHELLMWQNSSGELSPATSSPETTGGSVLSDQTSVHLLLATSLSSPQPPLHPSDSISVTAGESFQLQPLAEMEVIGACRRGRRRGRRNRTAAERISEAAQRRDSKNARERQRVENVKNEYARLQELLGLTELKSDSKEHKRHCKLRTLTAAIERIRTLMAIDQLTSREERISIELRESLQQQQRGEDGHSVEQRRTDPQPDVVKRIIQVKIVLKLGYTSFFLIQSNTLLKIIVLILYIIIIIYSNYDYIIIIIYNNKDNA